MNYETFQTVSHFFLLAGMIIAALGGFGGYYFEKKANYIRAQAALKQEVILKEKIDTLLEESKETQKLLMPFEELARTRYPDKEIKEGLEALTKDIDEVSARTQLLEERATPRTISKSSEDHIISILEKHAGSKITFLAVMGETETLQFAASLSGLFKKAGWQSVFAQSTFSKAFKGIHIGVSGHPISETAKAVANALKVAGFESQYGLQPKLKGEEIEVRVGPKH